jgi:hypothetical protein
MGDSVKFVVNVWDPMGYKLLLEMENIKWQELIPTWASSRALTITEFLRDVLQNILISVGK